MESLEAAALTAAACTRCPQLAEARTQVVFGAGRVDADLFFVGEAPGRGEDEQGVPLAGRASELLDELLGAIGLSRADVFLTHALMCRPPGNRDPLPQEITNCADWLATQLDLVQPKLVCTLGNHATKLLRGDATAITKLHGQAEVRVIGTRAVRLLPLYHPVAALYTTPLLDTLREDFARIPALLAMEPPEQPAAPPVEQLPPETPGGDVDPQLGLF